MVGTIYEEDGGLADGRGRRARFKALGVLTASEGSSTPIVDGEEVLVRASSFKEFAGDELKRMNYDGFLSYAALVHYYE